MARGMPSMLALLGLLAVAGYQNRDKIGAALNNLQTGSAGTQGGLGNILGGLNTALGGAGTSGGLAGGLGELLNSFKSAGHQDVADSWVNPAVPTRGLTPDQVRESIGEENLAELSQRVGMSQDELLKRLATAIPEAVDKLTPGGQMPTEDQLRRQLLPS